jgi:hypothetical protein
VAGGVGWRVDRASPHRRSWARRSGGRNGAQQNSARRLDGSLAPLRALGKNPRSLPLPALVEKAADSAEDGQRLAASTAVSFEAESWDFGPSLCKFRDLPQAPIALRPIQGAADVLVHIDSCEVMAERVPHPFAVRASIRNQTASEVIVRLNGIEDVTVLHRREIIKAAAFRKKVSQDGPGFMTGLSNISGLSLRPGEAIDLIVVFGNGAVGDLIQFGPDHSALVREAPHTSANGSSRDVPSKYSDLPSPRKGMAGDWEGTSKLDSAEAATTFSVPDSEAALKGIKVVFKCMNGAREVTTRSTWTVPIAADRTFRFIANMGGSSGTGRFVSDDLVEGELTNPISIMCGSTSVETRGKYTARKVR